MQPTRLSAVTAGIGIGLLALSACTGPDDADYPSEAIDLTIPFGPGGATDLAARAMSESLADELGQPVNPTNREGANQISAVSHVTQAQPDGYTLLADGGGSSTLQSLLDELPYQWEDRTFVAQVATGGHAYAVGDGSGIATMDELAEVIQADPSGFSVAWLGGTSTSDFATLQLLEELEVDPNEVNRVPFSGTGDAMQAAAAGDVDLAAGGSSSISSLYSSGDLVPLALTAEDPNFPEVPLTSEMGYAELDMSYWVGLSGPADLPDPVVNVLGETLAELEDDPELNDAFKTLGMTVDVVTGDELQAYIHDEAENFASLNDLVAD